MGLLAAVSLIVESVSRFGTRIALTSSALFTDTVYVSRGERNFRL